MLTRADLAAGAKHAWGVERTEIVVFAATLWIIAAAAAIGGVAWWVPALLFLGGLVPAIEKTVKRARQWREFRDWWPEFHRQFYAALDHYDEQRPETD